MAATKAAVGAGPLNARADAFSDAGGPSLAMSLDFLRGPVDSRIVATRASAATYFDSAGILRSAAAGVARIDHDPVTLARRGLLIEEQRSNGIRTNDMTGGAPGTLPTYWTTGVPTGVTATVVGVFTVAGMRVLRLTFAGTPTQTAPAFVTFMASIFFPALAGVAAGTAFTQSAYLALYAGTWSGVGSLKHYAGISDATLNGVHTFQDAAGALPGAALTRYVITRDIPAPGGSTAPYDVNNPGFDFMMTSGSPVNFTVDIGLPQVEIGSHASSPIVTTGAAGTRAKDLATMSAAGWFDPARPATFIVESLHTVLPAAAAARRLWSLSDGTNSNLVSVVRVGATDTVGLAVTSGGSAVATGLAGHAVTAGVVDKYAVGFTPGGIYRDAANGVAGGMSTAVAVPSGLNAFTLGALATNAQQMNGYLQRVRYHRKLMQRDEMAKRTA